MPLVFYPQEEGLAESSITEKIEILMEAAERYKAVVLDAVDKPLLMEDGVRKRMTPRDISVSYNWDELVKVLRQVRDLPEASEAAKITKADYLTKLSEVYELLRAAKMPKLEAVRLALKNEANQLSSGGSQVA